MAGNLKYKFSGHQTFAFRYGWLEKGVRGVAACPTLFSEDDALVRLGVGKNMVDSIRHWCQVTQLLEPDSKDTGNTSRHLRITGIAFAGVPRVHRLPISFRLSMLVRRRAGRQSAPHRFHHEALG
jgi:hypothetical protein